MMPYVAAYCIFAHTSQCGATESFKILVFVYVWKQDQ